MPQMQPQLNIQQLMPNLQSIQNSPNNMLIQVYADPAKGMTDAISA